MLILPVIPTETEFVYNEMITAVEPFLARGWCDWVTKGVKSLSVALRGGAYNFKKRQRHAVPLCNRYKKNYCYQIVIKLSLHHHSF